MADNVIDWSKFSTKSKFVSFEDEKVKKLVVTNWREGSVKFGEQPEKPSLVFDVVSEDGEPCEKTLEVSNHTFVMGLRPVVEAADKAGLKMVKFAAKRSGTGKATVYMVMGDL